MKITEIRKNLYKVEFETEIPIYISMDSSSIRLTQPILKESKGEKFKEGKYFGRGFPQEIIISKRKFKEVFETLNKILIIENLE